MSDNVKIEIKLDNRPKIKGLIKTQLLLALEKCGMVCEGYAKDLCPVRNPKGGDLRDSITHKVIPQEKAVYIGSDLKYAPYVELGTGKYYKGGRRTKWRYQDDDGNWHTTEGQKPQPYLKPAAADHLDEYRKIIKSTLEK